MNSRFVRHHWLLALGATLLFVVTSVSDNRDGSHTADRAVPSAA